MMSVMEMCSRKDEVQDIKSFSGRNLLRWFVYINLKDKAKKYTKKEFLTETSQGKIK